MTTERFTLHHGNCLDVLRTMPDNSVDAIVTDPPYGLEFMGKEWDAPWKNSGTVLDDPASVGGFQDGAGGNPYSRSRIRYGRENGAAVGFQLWFHEIAVELLRVLKPGGHLLAFGGTRTYHRLACAVEDAGFEIRDSLHWLYGSGFPKSLDVSKAIDKAAGAERVVTGTKRVTPKGVSAAETRTASAAGAFGGEAKDVPITAPATDDAHRWQGWGTALKPAHEPIVLARKPFAGTVAANVLEHGTAALNIDATRIGRQPTDVSVAGRRTATFGTQETVSGGDGSGGWTQNDAGRWPPNVLHDGDPEIVERFPTTSTWAAKNPKQYETDSVFGVGGINFGKADEGSAARFFPALGFDDTDAASFLYCAKPNKKERNAGLDHLPKQQGGGMAGTADKSLKTGSGNERDGTAQNFHPTVKPLALMRWLVRLVTPPDGVVLDPFAGSGTTLCAALLESKQAVGIEMTDDYLPIIRGRVAWAQQQATTEHATTNAEPVQPSLFE